MMSAPRRSVAVPSQQTHRRYRVADRIGVHRQWVLLYTLVPSALAEAYECHGLLNAPRTVIQPERSISISHSVFSNANVRIC